MKTRIFFTALMIAAISCCWNPPLEAALPAGAQWEVRTTGNDLNGGFFNTAGGSGTDYSQQDAAQLTVTDGVTSTTTLTSVTGGFTAAMVHNGVQLSGGTCTAGIYDITVVTNSNTVTIDSSGGAAGAGCTVKVGGGLLTIAKALANVVTNSGNTFNTIWVKSGTYTQTATLTWGTAITAAMQGYNTTHGDLGTAPLITTATDSTVLMVIGNVDQVTLTNLSMSNTATVRAIGISSNNGGGDVVRLNAVNVILDGFTNGINTTTTTFKRLFLSGVEIKNSTAAGILFTENTVKFISIVGSYIHNNTGAGLSNAGASGLSLFLRSSVFDSNAGNGLAISNSRPIRWTWSRATSRTTPGGYIVLQHRSEPDRTKLHFLRNTPPME